MKLSIPRAVILVPRRADGGERDALWAFCKQWWETKAGIPVFEGYHEEGELFCASAARNAAARLAGDWEIGVFCDSDTIVFPMQLVTGIETARRTGRTTLPFTSRIELSAGQTQRFLSSNQLPNKKYVNPIAGHPSGVVIVPRTVWGRVGGYDEGFIGWGCQDSDFLWRCEKVCGNANRIHGDAYHLWHSRPKQAVPSSEIYQNNRARLVSKHGDRRWDT